MADDWERLAGAIRASRTKLRMTQKQLAQAAGVAQNTIKNLEAGLSYSTRPRKLPEVARALGWAPESIEDVLAGGDPVEAPPEPAAWPGGMVAPAGMSERVRQAIESGAVMDAQVLEMSGDQPGMRMVTLLMRDQDAEADPEVVRANLAKFDRLQREAQRLALGDDS